MWNKNKIDFYFAVIFSSILFGFVHILNFLIGDANLIETLCQVGYAVCIGVMLAAIMLRSSFSLWWCILLHSLFDIANGLGTVASYKVINYSSNINHVNSIDEVLNMLTYLPLLVFGLFLLRKVRYVDDNYEIS